MASSSDSEDDSFMAVDQEENVLDIKDTKEKGRVKWKVFNSSSVVGPPETSLHTVVRGRGELIIFGGLMDKKQNVKYYPKTNALYFVRAKR